MAKGLNPLELAAENRKRKIGTLKYDSEIYVQETVKRFRHVPRHDMEEFNKWAADMIKRRSTAPCWRGLNTANLDLSRRQDELVVVPPPLQSLQKMQEQMRAALSAYQKCMAEIYRPVLPELERRRFEQEIPEEALQEMIEPKR